MRAKFYLLESLTCTMMRHTEPHIPVYVYVIYIRGILESNVKNGSRLTKCVKKKNRVRNFSIDEPTLRQKH